MTARRPNPESKPNPTPLYEVVCAQMRIRPELTYRPAVVLADALLPSLHQLEPLP